MSYDPIASSNDYSGAPAPGEAAPTSNFIHDIIDEDLARGKHQRVVTRFPPEPNGYLHIGHAKAIALNFGTALKYGGACHLRMDDTNPTTENVEFVENIQRDIKWLGFDWGEHLYYASDYFDQMADYAEQLIRAGKAYVDSQGRDALRESRGTLTEPGAPSPFRDRPVEESLDLFHRMRSGEFEDGTHVLRAKIDMSSPNMLMRDPVLYRILHAHHYRHGDKWCVYPLYDFAHCLEDSIEGVTHSLCTLEFENNRELYDWLLDELQTPCHPQQIEFARLNLTYTVMSKRKLLQLVKEGLVRGWDDPRLPTLAGLRRRGVPPEAIRGLCEMIGVSKANSTVDIEKLEYCIRDELNHRAPRVLAVLRPLKVVLENWPEDRVEWLDAPLWPHDVPKLESRQIPFSRVLYVERDDFREDPPSGWHRLAPGREVRLRHAFYVTCREVVKDERGEVVELRCTLDPETRGGWSADGRKVKGTLHWVSAAHSVACEVRLYDRLFRVERPDADAEVDFKSQLNPNSLEVITGARVEPSLAEASGGQHYQFERLGYFWPDPVDSAPGQLVFNRIIPLRDTWAKLEAALTGEREVVETSEQPVVEADSAPARPRSWERDQLRAIDPGLQARYRQYLEVMQLDPDDADILSGDRALAEAFEQALMGGAPPQAVANWFVNEVLREVKDKPLDRLLPTPRQIGELVALLAHDVISTPIAKQVFAEMLLSGSDPQVIVKTRDLEKVSDSSTLAPVVDRVIAASPSQVEAYRGGKASLLGFFVGQVMKASQGKADPKIVKELLEARLGGNG